jgi:hypothetical protein
VKVLDFSPGEGVRAAACSTRCSPDGARSAHRQAQGRPERVTERKVLAIRRTGSLSSDIWTFDFLRKEAKEFLATLDNEGGLRRR